jgi:hypothetical protein
MSRTRDECESLLRFNETDEAAYVSTFSPVQARRWQRAGATLTRRGTEWVGRVDKRWIRLRKPRQLNLTSAQRAVKRAQWLRRGGLARPATPHVTS